MTFRYPERPVLIVDDEPYILKSLSAVLRSAGINNLQVCEDSREVYRMVSTTKPSLVLLDLTMPYKSGEVVLQEVKELYPDLPVTIITGVNELSTAVECMKRGASDYLVKAIENSKLLSSVKTALNFSELEEENRLLKRSILRDDFPAHPAFDSILTEDRAMFSIFRYLTVISPSGQTILIRGETGTGKELVAEAIHKVSGRPGEFICINAAGLDDVMFSDTLFGHRRGAYSGADSSRPGLIEKAAGGTLFLDEIGDLSPANQIKLLRLLEKSEYYALGSDTLKRASCRIVAATNCELETKIEEGSFRRDLYFRLSSHEVMLPPLRDRPDDIPLLIHHFVKLTASELNITPPEISPSFIHSFYDKELPGNVRELMTIINRAVGSQGGSKLFGSGDDGLTDETLMKSNSSSLPIFPEELPDLKLWADILVDEALARSEGNISSAARLLGISQPALSKRMAKRRI
ncbi:MAG: sigma-54-dependent Fis family transcriptional regulator [Spirochaetales bacterium]|nr:sigma-54-dependent Fis family transcriptional regulator [Spirochaetales bacterium]